MSDTDIPDEAFIETGAPDDELASVDENELLDDETVVSDTDLAGPTDDEPIFDELQPGDLSGDEPIELQ